MPTIIEDLGEALSREMKARGITTQAFMDYDPRGGVANPAKNPNPRKIAEQDDLVLDLTNSRSLPCTKKQRGIDTFQDDHYITWFGHALKHDAGFQTLLATETALSWMFLCRETFADAGALSFEAPGTDVQVPYFVIDYEEEITQTDRDGNIVDHVSLQILKRRWYLV